MGRSQCTKVSGSGQLNNKKQDIVIESRISPSFLSSPTCHHNLRLIWVGSQPACPHSSPDPGKTVGKLINCSSQLQQPRPEIETCSWMLAMHREISRLSWRGEEEMVLRDHFTAPWPLCVLISDSKAPEVYMDSGFCLWLAGNYKVYWFGTSN